MTDKLHARHDVGWIQPFASVVAYGAEDERVVAASANIHDFIDNMTPAAALGQKAEEVLGGQLVHAVRNAQSLPVFDDCPEPLGAADLGMGLLEASGFGAGGLIVVDFMEGQAQLSSLDLLKDVARLSERIQGASDTQALLNQLSSLIRIMSGYDRVQALRLGSGDGCTIVAESRRAALPDCLGQTVPCPEQVAAFPHPPFHYIRNVADIAVAVRAAEPVKLDLSLLPASQPREGRLDSLEQQGMQAELVLPLSIDGRLWGALLFQHRRPRAPTPRFRQTIRAVRPLLEAWLARFEAPVIPK